MTAETRVTSEQDDDVPSFRKKQKRTDVDPDERRRWRCISPCERRTSPPPADQESSVSRTRVDFSDCLCSRAAERSVISLGGYEPPRRL
ncbi:hypothetical protein F2P81_017635 [Scophthalmus maximus]|uniref:Uncharacterized protein n=1 Tax=Scophthalmus maximus TaxID=52904 RepID=A0A6A4SIV8_SCOMX|nr:hypothetical protein F2P81_017635 [Scophthalmus maximus]